MIANGRPIGVFDSGMGGLTVLAALRRALPAESFVYLGDTARLPYGTKSPETVCHYALQATRALSAFDVKLLVVACNTASAVALGALAEAFAPIPVIGVVEPGAEAGVRETRNGHIAVLATESTVRGGAYVRAIKARDTKAKVSQLACGLFVALAEEGWTEGPVAEGAAHRYLDAQFAATGSSRPDTLVLGCTHFPVLRTVIRKVVGPAVAIVDSAATTAEQVRSCLADDTRKTGAGAIKLLVTDAPERFARIGSIFLGESLDPADISLIDLSAGRPTDAPATA